MSEIKVSHDGRQYVELDAHERLKKIRAEAQGGVSSVASGSSPRPAPERFAGERLEASDTTVSALLDELNRLAQYIIDKAHLTPRDHACPECYPYETTRLNWQCCYHRALAIVAMGGAQATATDASAALPDQETVEGSLQPDPKCRCGMHNGCPEGDHEACVCLCVDEVEQEFDRSLARAETGYEAGWKAAKESAVQVLLAQIDEYRKEFNPDGSSYSVMKRDVCFTALRKIRSLKIRSLRPEGKESGK